MDGQEMDDWTGELTATLDLTVEEFEDRFGGCWDGPRGQLAQDFDANPSGGTGFDATPLARVGQASGADDPGVRPRSVRGTAKAAYDGVGFQQASIPGDRSSWRVIVGWRLGRRSWQASSPGVGGTSAGAAAVGRVKAPEGNLRDRCNRCAKIVS